MNEILLNTALWMLNDYCEERGISQAGTRCVKDGRGFSFVLRKERPDDPRWPDIARITFHKNRRPSFGWA